MILTHRGPADWFGQIRAQMMDSNSHKRKQDLELTQRAQMMDSNSHKRSLVDCWTSQVNAAGEHIASAFTGTPVRAVSSQSERRCMLCKDLLLHRRR
jgi:hypothetical protein